METVIEQFYEDFQVLSSQLRYKDFENYQSTIQSGCYNPNKLLKALHKVDNAIIDLMKLYNN